MHFLFPPSASVCLSDSSLSLSVCLSLSLSLSVGAVCSHQLVKVKTTQTQSFYSVRQAMPSATTTRWSPATVEPVIAALSRKISPPAPAFSHPLYPHHLPSHLSPIPTLSPLPSPLSYTLPSLTLPSSSSPPMPSLFLLPPPSMHFHGIREFRRLMAQVLFCPYLAATGNCNDDPRRYFLRGEP